MANSFVPPHTPEQVIAARNLLRNKLNEWLLMLADSRKNTIGELSMSDRQKVSEELADWLLSSNFMSERFFEYVIEITGEPE